MKLIISTFLIVPHSLIYESLLIVEYTHFGQFEEECFGWWQKNRVMKKALFLELKIAGGEYAQFVRKVAFLEKVDVLQKLTC